jgi:Concanavalin A-like lectin/glucanases superfamily
VAYRDVVLADGPIALWPLGADWTDVTGHGYTLTPGAGSPTAGQASIVPTETGGGSTHLDGSAWLGTVIFRYVYPADAQSVEMWVQTTADGSLVGAYPSYRLLVTGGKLAVEQDNGANRIVASSAPDVTDGQPHHLVAAWADGHAVKLYQDGVLVASGDCYQTTYGSPPQGGSIVYGATPWLNGYVQDLATYAFELSSVQVAAHYAAGVPVTGPTTWDASGSGASTSEGRAAAALAHVWDVSAAGASGSGGHAAASVPVPALASASGSSSSAARAAAILATAWPARAVGASDSAGTAAASLYHAWPARAVGASDSLGRATATVDVDTALVRPLPLGAGSYNGVSWGPGQQIQIVKHEGLDETAPVRNTDQDRGGQDGQWSGRDLYGPRTVTITFAVLGRDNQDLRALLAVIERAWREDSVDRPMRVFNGERTLTARIRHRAFDQPLGGRDKTSTVVVQWYAKDPYYYESEQTVILRPNVPVLLLNPGDVSAPIHIRLVGPAAAPSFSNDTLPAQLWLNVTLDTGEVLDIDSDLRSILLNGVPSSPAKDPRSLWWDLFVGVNQVRYTSASGSPAEQAHLTYAVARI